MKWVKERDLLIAQALAFVQSVSGKKEDAGKPDAEPDIEAAPIEAIIDDAIKEPIRIAGRTKEIPANVEVLRTIVPSDFRTEIQHRVANFRAHQERFHREREEYFSTTLAKARAALGEDSTSPPLRK
jgi:hypothetical protein